MNLEAIHGRAPNPVPPGDAVAMMAVLETCFASARLGLALPVRAL